MLCVLRLGHRRERDGRLTTHVFLAARALGADCGILSGEEDEGVLRSVKGVVSRWGGRFEVCYEQNWGKVIRDWKKTGGKVAHLTMYGERAEKKMGVIRKAKKLLVVVGGEKVRAEVYRLADWNVSVTNQPHSEVAALAVFLHAYYGGKELGKRFARARIKIIPDGKRKIIKNCKTQGYL